MYRQNDGYMIQKFQISKELHLLRYRLMSKNLTIF